MSRSQTAVSVSLLLSILLIEPAICFTRITTQSQSRHSSYRQLSVIASNDRHQHHPYNNRPSTQLAAASSVFHDLVTTLLSASSTTAAQAVETDIASASAPTYQPGVDTAVFVAGLFPFLWATWEFWRRIAVGAPFGTGRDSIRIPSPWANDESADSQTETLDMDGETSSSSQSPAPRRRVLDKGSLITAYVLFTLAGAAMALTIYSVVTSAPLPAGMLVTGDAVTDVTQL